MAIRLTLRQQTRSPYPLDDQTSNAEASRFSLVGLVLAVLSTTAAITWCPLTCSAQSPPIDILSDTHATSLTMSVAPLGAVDMVWLDMSQDQNPTIMGVTNPGTQDADVLATLEDIDTDSLKLALSPGDARQLSWLAPLTSTMRLCTAPLTATSSVSCDSVPAHDTQVLAIDHQGQPHLGWAEDEAFIVLNTSTGVSRTIELSADMTPHAIQMAIAQDGQAHIIFLGDEPSAGLTSLYYASTIGNSLPITLTGEAISPCLALDLAGLPHIVWGDGESILYAKGPDWAEPDTVAIGPAATRWDIAAASPDEVRIAWASVHGIWTAHSLDWALTRHHLLKTDSVAALKLGIDSLGQMHLGWLERDPQGGDTIRYWREMTQATQIRITYPMPDAYLFAGDAIHAVTVPPQGWDNLAFYLAPADDDATPSGWIHIGTDRDPADGWSAMLPEDILPGAFRTQVIGITTDGATRCAEGNTLTIGPDIGGQVAFAPEHDAPLRGKADVRMIWLPALPGQASPISLDLYLRSTTCDQIAQPCTSGSSLPPTSLYYIGRHTLRRTASPNVTVIRVSSLTVPDGTYSVLPREVESGIWWPSDGMTVEVDNGMLPNVTVSAAALDQPHSMVPITATATDADGIVERVDFYLQGDTQVLSTPSGIVSVPRRIWVGADDTPQNGWGLDLAINDTWRNQNWSIVAEATDNSGASRASTSPDTFHLPAIGMPDLTVLSPTAQESVRGLQRIVISSQTSGADTTILAYLVDKANRLRALGQVRTAWPGWQMDWDTGAFADGEYHMLFVASQQDGSASMRFLSPTFRIANRSADIAFVTSPSDATLTGSVFLYLRQTGTPKELESVTYCWRDSTGAMGIIGQDTSPNEAWGVLWNTSQVFDGDYTLLALVSGADGSHKYAKAVTVDNGIPKIDLLLGTSVSFSDKVELRWLTSGLNEPDATVEASYSPDDGHHWQPLARVPASDRSLVFDSSDVPDSTTARVRVIASDGAHWCQDTSPTLTIDNHNAAPRVSLLSPRPNHNYAQDELIIAWEAIDPDSPLQSDALQIDLDYRTQGSGWRTARRDLAPRGSFVLDDAWLQPDQSYAFRLTARDSLGASTSTSVEGVTLWKNHSPNIRLLWPNSPVAMEGEAIILWQADDPDGDPLSIDLYYSDNGGQGWLPLAENLPNTGYYGWQLAFLPPSSQYRLRAVASDGSRSATTESLFAFTIGNHHQQIVSLLSPEPGERVSGLTLLSWSTLARARTTQASIEIRHVGRNVWQSLASVTNQDHYIWRTTALPDGLYDLRVTISDTTGIANVTSSEPVHIVNRAPHNLQVELLAPQGGEYWDGTREIRWSALASTDSPLTATLSTSQDKGVTWHSLGQTDARSESYLVSTTDLGGSATLFAVALSDGTNVVTDTSSSQINLMNAPQHIPQIHILGPWAQGPLLRGDTLAWRAYDQDYDPLRITVWQSSSSGSRWEPISQRLANTGLFVLDGDMPPESDMLIMATATDGIRECQSKAISVRPQVPENVRATMTLLTPSEGQVVSGETAITWDVDTPAGLDGSLSIDVSPNAGQSWLTVARDLAPDQSYTWDTTQTTNGTYLIRLNLVADLAQQSVVSAPVVVQNADARAANLSLYSPAGAKVWSGLQDIRWQATDGHGNDLPVTLYYSVDRGASWVTIARNLRGSSVYTWDTTLAPNCDILWLKAETDINGQIFQAISRHPIAIANLVGPVARLWIMGKQDRWMDDITICWAAKSQTGQPPLVTIEYSVDTGATWQELAHNLDAEGEIAWDASDLAPQTPVILRMRASDRGLTAISTLWEPLVANDSRPERLPPYF